MARQGLGRDLEGFVRGFIGFAGWRAAAAAGLIAAAGLFDGVGLLLLVPVLDVVTSPVSGHGVGGFTRPLAHLLDGLDRTERLAALLVLFGLLVAARCLVVAVRERHVSRLQTDFVEATRMRLIARLAAADWSNVARLNHARVVQALSVEIHQVGVAANSAMLTLVAAAMVAVPCLLALLLAPLAGAAAIGFALLGALLSRPYLGRARTLGLAITQANFGMTEGAVRFLAGLKLASAQGQQGEFVREYGATAAAASAQRLDSLQLQTGLRNLTSLLAAAVATATLVSGIMLFDLPAPVLIALLVILARISGPALSVHQGSQQLMHSLPAYGVIQTLEAELSGAQPAPEVDAPETTPDLTITFDRVSFSHGRSPDAATTLHEACLEIPAGAFVGITGPSGSGKTSFIDLAAGVLSPQSGQIRVAGQRLNGPALARHRRRLAYVGQDPFLFDDTVRRNLTWSRPPSEDDDLWTALETTGAAALVRALDGGLDARIGERGVLVSAGERQRLALARALLRRPALLILDEATNALDAAAEAVILERLAALRPRMTVLMAAHRSECLAFCDHLLRFPGPVLSRLRPMSPRLAVVP